MASLVPVRDDTDAISITSTPEAVRCLHARVTDFPLTWMEPTLFLSASHYPRASATEDTPGSERDGKDHHGHP